MQSTPAKVGLVLSGGGAKGAYQVGIIKYLEESGITIDAIAGASIGALNGAIISSAKNLTEASQHLAELWGTLATEPPLKFKQLPYAAYASYLAYVLIAGSSRLSSILSVTHHILDITEQLCSAGICDDSYIQELINNYTSPQNLQNGLPLYVSIYQSEGGVDTIVKSLMGALGISDTKHSEFRHIQSLPLDKQQDIIFASASLPLIFRPQEIDGQNYFDGGIGGWTKSQGNTPITPLIEKEQCTHIIVTHLSNGSLWNHHEFSGVEILEIRPKNNIAQEGMIKDLLNFKADKIDQWIEQGYEDANRCISNTAKVIKLHHDAILAAAQRDAIVDVLDNDIFL